CARSGGSSHWYFDVW
nr:immunoglobulin heavy chain junction region [Mus musculus]